MTVHASSHHTLAPHLPSGLPMLEARHTHEPPPVAAHRIDGHGTLLATCPCEPGRTSRTEENQQNGGQPAEPGFAAALSWPLKSEKNCEFFIPVEHLLRPFGGGGGIREVKERVSERIEKVPGRYVDGTLNISRVAEIGKQSDWK